MVKQKSEYQLSPMKKHFDKLIVKLLAREPTPPPNVGRLHILTWLFKKTDFPCGACNRIDDVQFMVLSTGVYRSCKFDGFTEKVEPVNDNGQEAILLEDKICSSDTEAMEVIKRYHQERIYCDPDASLNLPEYRPPRKAGRIRKPIVEEPSE
jgi:hypothetical protein